MADVEYSYGALVFSPIYVDFNVCRSSEYGPEGRAACLDALEGKAESLERFNHHRAWMRNHPLKCLRDAYAKDRALMDYLEPILRAGWTNVGIYPDEFQSRINSFTRKLGGWVGDCY